MTTSGNGNGQDAAADTKALRLLALEAAGAVPALRRRLLAAAAPVLGLLMQRYLVHDIQTPDWPDRDRLVFSPALQPLACAQLHLLGQEQEAFAQEEGNEPERGEDAAHDSGNGEAEDTGEATVDVLAAQCDLARGRLDLPFELPGHGLAAAVGMALAARLLRERFGPEIFNHATCVLVDDDDLEPGIAQEAIAIAPWLRPHRLLVLHMTPGRGEQDGRQRQCPSHISRFAAAGWHVQQARVDDEESIISALEQAMEQEGEGMRPAYVAVEFDPEVEVPSTTFLRQQLGWEELVQGDVPGTVRDAWRLAGLRGRKQRKAWEQRVAALPAEDQASLQRRLQNPLPEDFRQRMRRLRGALAEHAQARDVQGLLAALLAESQETMRELVCLSALGDALPATETLPTDAEQQEGAATDDAAQVMDLGLRPMALAALLAGMSAHGGVRVAGVVRRHQLATMLPMLGEAGRLGLACTVLVLDDAQCGHAPVEVMPAGVACMCPADAVELVECWQVSMQQPRGPAVLLIPAGELPPVRTSVEKQNLSALGGYELFAAEGDVQAVLFAAGRPLAAALMAAQSLEQDGVAVRVVSVPAPHLLEAQDEERRGRILMGRERLRLLVPPGAVAHLWSLLVREEGVVSPCGRDGRPLPTDVLAETIRQMVLRQLQGDAADEVGDDAASDGGEKA